MPGCVRAYLCLLPMCSFPSVFEPQDFIQKFMQKQYTKTALSLLALFVFLFGSAPLSHAQVNLEVGDLSGATGDSITVPVTVSDLTGEDVTSYQFTVAYDTSVVELTDVSAEGTLSADGSIQSNTSDGEISVAFAGSEALSGSGTLVELKGVVNRVGTTSLSFAEAQLFDSDAQDVPVTTADGSLVAGIGVDLPDAVGLIGVEDTIQVPVQVSDVTGEDLTAYQFTVSYDPNIVEITGATGEGTLSADGSLDSNSPEPGVFNVALAGSEALEGSGDLVFLEVALVAEGTSPLAFDSFSFFDSGGNEVNSATTDGSVTVAQPAQAQIIHNAADPAADTVDVYINGELTRDDFAFREATPFMGLPAGVELNVGIAPGNSSSAADTLANFPVTLEADQNYTMVANGVVNPDDFADNPGGASTGLDLFVAPDAQVAASSESSVDFRAVHGVTDAPAVDVISVAGPTLIDDATYGDVSGYLSTEPDASVVTVAPGDGGSPLAAFEIDLSGAGGTALTVLASGFLEPGNNQDGSTFTLVAAFPDGTVQTLESLAFPQDVTANASEDFGGDATNADNYALVGLPGSVDLPMENTTDGSPPEDWRAFWDTGAQSAEEGLIEFDGTDTFNFRPGRGFWLLSSNPWSVSQTFGPVTLNADGTYGVNLHNGWRIISNPFEKDIPWAAIQAANGVSQSLWRFQNGSFSQVQSFESASGGEAFYFLNDQGLSELAVPFFLPGGGSQAAFAEKSAASSESQALTLTAFQEDTRVSSIEVGLAESASEGRDQFDQFAPPAHFQSTTLRLTSDEVQSKYASGLAVEYRPIAAEGQRFNLTLDAEPGESITLEASGLSAFADREVKLIRESNSMSYDLHETSTVTVTPESENTDYVLLLGSADYVDSEQSEVVPDEVKLLPNYPNPFQGQTTLRFTLPEQQEVRLVIYDVLGRAVRTLVNEQKQSGVHSIRWDGRNNAGQPVASGLYLGRLEVGETTQTRKLLLVK